MNRQDVIEILRTVAARVDGSLSKRTYDAERDEEHPAATTIQKRYGWNAIKDDADLATATSPGSISKEDALAVLKTVAQRVGGPLTIEQYNDHRDPTHPAAKTLTRHGGWNALKDEAGLETTAAPRTPLSKTEALTALTTVAQRVEGTLTVEQYETHRDDDHPHGVAIAESFGWNAIKEEADLAISTRGPDGVSQQTAIAALQTVAQRVDGPLTQTLYETYRDEEHPHMNTLARQYEWTALKAEAGCHTE